MAVADRPGDARGRLFELAGRQRARQPKIIIMIRAAQVKTKDFGYVIYYFAAHIAGPITVIFAVAIGILIGDEK